MHEWVSCAGGFSIAKIHKRLPERVLRKLHVTGGEFLLATLDER
jgi:hypothetical protein